MDGQQVVSAICEADDVRAAKRHQHTVLFARVSSLADDIAFAIREQRPLEEIRDALVILGLGMMQVNHFSLWLDHELSGAKPQ